MVAKRLEDLIIWQLGVELRRLILAITDRPPFNRDFDLFNQIRSAATSIPANIAEGFARVAPTEFSRFLLYARGSLKELETHLHDAHERGYLSDHELRAAETLCRRIGAGSWSLLQYLRRYAAQRKGSKSCRR